MQKTVNLGIKKLPRMLFENTGGWHAHIRVHDGLRSFAHGSGVSAVFTTKTKGTGLGLATVRQLMESLGGGLSITSTPGKGTAVDLWLPAMSAWFAD